MSSEPPTTRLFALIDSIRASAAAMPTRDLPPSELVLLWRVSSVANEVSSLRDFDGRALPKDAVKLAALDAEVILRELEARTARGRSPEIDLELAAQLADRIMESVGYLATIPERERTEVNAERGPDAQGVKTDARTLGSLAGRYEKMAIGERKFAARASIVALLLVIVGAAVVIAGVQSARRAAGVFEWPVFAGYAVVGLVLLLGSLTAIRIASRHTGAAREAWSIQCQLEGLDDYLAPIPAAARALIRATLVQRIFPAPRETDEPWREPRWPDAATLMAAIDARDERDNPEGKA